MTLAFRTKTNDFIILTLMSLLCFFFSCETKKHSSGYSDVRSITFELYKKKYAHSIQYYSSPKDSLKLKALYYILKNLDDQYFFKGDWIDDYNQTIINSKDKSVNSLIFKLDSITKIYSYNMIVVHDSEVITDSYLIENIDKAFKSREYSWTRNVSFTDFCEYVLPYKIGNERPEAWGMSLDSELFLKRDSLSKIKDIFEATRYVNNHLSWFQMSSNYDYPVDAGYKMLRLISTGTCFTSTKMALIETRSLGLPVVIDFCPSWGNRSEGHHWNALIYENHPYPFDPTASNIGYYKIEFKGVDRLTYKISKVFRQTFSVQPDALASIIDTSDSLPKVFESKRIKDVTKQYVPVSDVILNYNIGFKDDIAYLCTFNDKAWIPSYWGKVEGNKIEFKNMGRDIVYLPSLYKGSKFIPIGNPFILSFNGQHKELKINKDITQKIVITKKYPEDETNNIYKGNKYELFYWDGLWQSLGTQIAKSNKLFYSGVPRNTLFWLRNYTKGKQERIFTYENNQQIWW